MLTRYARNSDNKLSHIDGDVQIGDVVHNYPDLTALERSIQNALRDNGTVSQYIDGLAAFQRPKTEASTIGLEAKLSIAGYQLYVERAVETKQAFSLYLEKSMYSISFQRIVRLFIEESLSVFQYRIRPMINQGEPPDVVMRAVFEIIIERIHRDSCIQNEHDFQKSFIEGMIFYLTGNCYMKWRPDDSIQQS